MSRDEVRAHPAVTLHYDGWQVWGGEPGRVRVGEQVMASVEFVQRSAPTLIGVEAKPHIAPTKSNCYIATARVLDTVGAVVLDLGALRALRWVRPGEDPGDFVADTTVSLDLSLNVNGWPDTEWTNRAAGLYGTNHTWLIHRILRLTVGSDDATEIGEASTDTVDSAHQYCLLECSRVD